jgi:hypothetical protein
MKTLTLFLCLLVGSVQFALAGGNSSIVDLDKVKSIKIEKGKITHIVGEGSLSKKAKDK